MDQQTLWQQVQPFAMSAIRRGLTAGAGILATHGVIANDQQNSFVEIGISVAMYAAAELWGWWNERGHAFVLAHLARLRGTTPAIAKASAIAAEEKIPAVLHKDNT